MRVLLDRCIGRSVKVELERAGHDVVWVGDWPEDPGDARILAVANEEQRALITADKDFGQLAVVYGLPHAGMIRLDRIPAHLHATECLRTLDQYATELEAGALITVQRGRIRIRRPAQGSGSPDSHEDTP